MEFKPRAILKSRSIATLLAVVTLAGKEASAALQSSSWLTYMDRQPETIARYARGFETINVFAYEFDTQDNIVPARPWVDETLDALMSDPARPRPVLITIVNDIRTEPFPSNHNGELIDRILRDPASRARHVQQLAALSARADGIDIDYEALRGGTREAFTQFIRELRAALPRGKKLSVVAQPKTDDGAGDRGRAIDWAAIAPHVDYLRVMVYYYSWNSSPPGPVATVAQTQELTRYALSRVPASKLSMVLTVFGWDWPEGGLGTLISYQRALDLAARHGATPYRDEPTGAVRVDYVDAFGVPHHIWIDDDASLRLKVDAIRAAGTERVDVWNLGSGDARFWDFMAAETLGNVPPPPDPLPSPSPEPPPAGSIEADPAFKFRALYAFPNPSRNSHPVTIRLQAGRADSVEVRVADPTGAQVAQGKAGPMRLVDDGRGAGLQYTFDYVWNVSGVGSGLYSYTVTAKKSGQADIRKSGQLAVLK